VRLLKVGLVDGRSARDRRPYGPRAAAVVVEIGAPVAGLTARIDRATTIATVGETVLSAAYVFIVGGDSAIVDATATRAAVAWETVIGADAQRALGPTVRPVLDLRQGDWIEYQFARSGILRLAVVFDGGSAALTSAIIAGDTLNVAQTPMRLTGQWEGSLAWRGAIGLLRFTVDSVSSEIDDLNLGVTCTDSAGRRRRILPSTQPDLTVSVPTPLAPIRADGAFAFDHARALIGGTGRFVTADSAAGTLAGRVLGCSGGRRVAMSGPWVARRSAPWVPPRQPYTFQVDSIVAPFSIRDAQLYQPSCGAVRDTGDFEMQPAEGGFRVRPPGGQMEISDGTYCIWPHGAVHRWVGTHNVVAGSIRSIRSDGTRPLRFRVHRDSGYVYVSGKGTLTTTDDRVVELPLGARLVGEDREIATMLRPEVRAVERYRRACDRGELLGCANLGDMYRSGRGVDGDSARAVNLYRQNVLRSSGLRPPTVNYARAVELYRQACDGGVMPGCARLGLMYELAVGVVSDDARAVELYRRACDSGFMPGCRSLGAMYSRGLGVPTSETRAVELYRRACDGAEMLGCADLGTMYADGRGVPQSDTRAAELYRQAVELFRRACDGGDLQGCANLGSAYSRGRGVVQSNTRAVELFRRACDGGWMASCSDLGVTYERGYGVAQNDTLGADLYRRACDGGFMLGCTLLGEMYIMGHGVPREPGTAFELYRWACDGGDNWGCERSRRMTGRPQN
jgi:hypothetical protein